MNVRTIVFVLAIFTLLSTATGGYLQYHTAQESALKQAERELFDVSKSLKNNVLDLIYLNQSHVRILARFEQIQEALLNQNQESLLQANRILDHFAADLAYDVGYLMDRSGNTIASSNRNQTDSFVGHNYSFRPYFLDAIQGRPSIFFAVGVTSEIRGIYVSQPVYSTDRSRPIGVAVIKVSIHGLEAELSHARTGIAMLVHSSGMIFVSSRDKWTLNFLWRVLPEELCQIAQTQQFGKGPWNWTGMEKKADNHAMDSSGEGYLIHEMSLENCPGWRSVSLYSVKEISGKFVDPLAGKTGYVALILCVLVGGAVVVLYVTAQHDIRSRNQAEETLRESEDKFSKAFFLSPDAIAITRLDAGVYVSVNEGCRQALGYAEEELIGKTSLELNVWDNPEDRNRVIEGLKAEGRVDNFEAHFRTKDGDIRYGLYSAAIIELNGVEHILNIARDISDRVRAEKEKESLMAQLLQAQKMEAIGTLASGVAHDFNNLLQIFGGYSELLLGDKHPEHKDYDKLHKINAAAKRGADLVQRLMVFSRKGDPKPRPLSLNHEVTEVKKLLERTIPKMIAIELSLESWLPVINADPVHVEQILLNLAINAKDAMPESGGKLTIETRKVTLDEEYCRANIESKPGQYVMLSVEDTGHGMSQETMQHIFEPFFTTKGAGRGTGLGLAMVYGIVKQYEGFISCYSEPSHGTTFRIYFPVVPTELEEDIEQDSAVPPGGSETVLLVDDEEFLCDTGSQLLTRAGYTVLTATNGGDALDLYRNQRGDISLVILDLIMPEMGGKECFKELVNIDPKVKVILSSGFLSDRTAEEATVFGVRGLVEKPYNMRELLQTVREVLDAD
ncbi:MAG: ATP-binding protein [Desulfomonile sp.]